MTSKQRIRKQSALTRRESDVVRWTAEQNTDKAEKAQKEVDILKMRLGKF
jgi:hypothetical protein